ncbi:hypothetical protein PvtlMGM1_1134 [Prevotella sp. MGM1]|nr:hypothetical protein PvtlMGM1_1134 [Prevotella sp. MGM1]
MVKRQRDIGHYPDKWLIFADELIQKDNMFNLKSVIMKNVLIFAAALAVVGAAVYNRKRLATYAQTGSVKIKDKVQVAAAAISSAVKNGKESMASTVKDTGYAMKKVADNSAKKIETA